MRRAIPSPYRTAAVLLLAAILGGCSQGYQQADCDPGYLKVKGECVLAVGPECERNRDCLTGICLVDPETTTLFCSIECIAQETCPTGFFCTAWADRHCYPGQRPPPCQQDDECDPCQECIDGNCQIEPGCLICLSDRDCGGCERCVDNECIPVAGCQPCSQDTECATCEICSDRMQCERLSGCQLCATDNDCPGCTRCDRGACIPIEGCGVDPCFNDLDCPSRTACLLDASTGLMVCLPVGLDFGQDCSRGLAPTCSGGVCLVDPASLEATCSQTCELDAQCPLGTVCEPDDDCLWACRPPAGTPPGAACGSDADCPEFRLCGLVADEQAGVWEARCKDPLACAGAAGESCGPETSGRCESSICAEFGLCSAVCAAHGCCPPEGLCVQLSLALPADGPSAAFWGCAPRSQARFEVGQPCPGGDQDCRQGSCGLAGTTGPTPRCTQTCTPGAAQCPDGFTCLSDPLDPQRQICLPAIAPGACTTDLDCPLDEICALAIATGLPTCSASLDGGAGPGQTCALDSDCFHGACSPAGICTTPCGLDGDCPAGLVCDTHRWPRADGQVSWVKRCALPPGSLAPCRSRLDCLAGEVCRPAPSWRLTGLEGRCGPAGSGVGEGEACQTGSGCESGACTAQQACTRLCAQDSDCEDPQRVCAPLALSGPAGQAWTSKACRPAPVGLGEPCPSGDDDCSSGLCHQPAEGEPYCTLACNAHEDCAEVEGMTCVADASGTTCRLP